MIKFGYVFIFTIALVAQVLLGVSPAHSSETEQLKQFFKDKWKLSANALKHIERGEVLVEAKVDSSGDQQSFSMQAAGLHPKNCAIALRKLSMLESYQDWISFVQSSHYNNRNKLFTLRADHALLPFPMIVHVIMDRPSRPGVYPFTFPTGIFAGLAGEYTITERHNRCLIYAKSHWSGKSSGIPNVVVKLFAEGLTKSAAELLIRKTRF